MYKSSIRQNYTEGLRKSTITRKGEARGLSNNDDFVALIDTLKSRFKRQISELIDSQPVSTEINELSIEQMVVRLKLDKPDELISSIKNGVYKNTWKNMIQKN
ncbi:MAG: hypothetical protein IPJ75_09605 [Ignavibacteriales bacterium]|nr:hypothetical protein [Ignavibacteriales bacterium]